MIKCSFLDVTSCQIYLLSKDKMLATVTVTAIMRMARLFKRAIPGLSFIFVFSTVNNKYVYMSLTN